MFKSINISRIKKKFIFFLFITSTLSILSQNQNEQIATGIIEYHNLFDKTMGNNISCYRIPAIVTAPNGDLIVAIDERVPSCGDLKWSKDINIVLRRSTDNGNSWSDIENIVDFPYGKSASDPSMIVDEMTGEIFLFYNFMDLDLEKDIYYLHFIKSDDNGKTWSNPVDITSQITKPMWQIDFKFITSGRGIQTQSGKLIHCLVNLDKGLHLFGSDDHGENWYLIDTPISPANESKIVELNNGTWMVNSRVQDQGMRYVHTSNNQGKSWVGNPEPNLIDPGCNASIIRYTSIKEGFNKNRLLFSNSKTKKGRKNMTVRISYDEGKSWSVGKTIYAGEAAYSSLTILKNGDIGLFFEKDNYNENVFVSFSLTWLTDGKDKLIRNKNFK